jgi:hypothetical protein
LICSFFVCLFALRSTLIGSSDLTTPLPAFLSACLALLVAFRLRLRL